MLHKPQDDQDPFSEDAAQNLHLGKEILDRCAEETVAAHLQELVSIPQVDGALYGIYYGNLLEGFLRGDFSGHTIMMHPRTLKSIMKACCAVGMYTQESIAKADEIWDAPKKPVKKKYHYCLSCKSNSVVDINERVCESCKEKPEDKNKFTYY